MQCASVFLRDPTVFLRDPSVFLQDTTVFPLETTGFLRETTGFLQETTGFLQETTGFLREPTGFLQVKAPGFLQVFISISPGVNLCAKTDKIQLKSRRIPELILYCNFYRFSTGILQ